MKKSNSFYSRTTATMIGLVSIQVVLIISTLLLGNGLRLANDAARESFENINSYRTTIVQNKLAQYQNIENNYSKINELASTFFNSIDNDIENLTETPSNSIYFTQKMVPEMINALRNSKATGAYLLLNNRVGTNYSFTHIKDLDPSTNPIDYSDLFLETGLPAVVEDYGIAGGSGRQNFLNRNTGNSDLFSYFDKILLENGTETYRFWTDSLRLKQFASETMLYGIPLSNRGKVYGLMGVSIDMNVFAMQELNYREIQSDGLGSYLFTRKVGENAYKVIVHDGAYIETFLPDNGVIEIDKGLIKQNVNKIACTLKPLRLYQNNAPFYQEYALIAITQSSRLTSASSRILQSVLIGLLISFAITVIISLLIAKFISKPLSYLAHEISKMNDEHQVLPYVNIEEVDALTRSINFFSSQIAESSTKLENIIELSGFKFGAYEYNSGDEKVYITNSMRRFLQIPESASSNSNYLPIEEISKYLEKFYQNNYKNEKFMFIVNIDNEEHIIKVNKFEEKTKQLGVFIDVTENIKEIDSVIYERDYDMLTGIFNRRAFSNYANELFMQSTFGAFIMLDIDGLKNVNDSHGHMVGDLYIKFIANRIRCLPFYQENILFGRASGDEFYIYIHNLEDKTEIRNAINIINDAINTDSGYINLTPNIRIKGGASIGYTWYPEDTNHYETLIRYADFAMYKSKKDSKGKMVEFDLKAFEAYLKSLDTDKALSKLIAYEAIYFCFQPIIDVHTANVYGYEALMRTNMPEFGGPLDILNEAAKTGKEEAVEHLTFFNSVNSFIERKGFDNYKLFINSIANVNLTKEAYEKLVVTFTKYFSNMVVEINEGINIIKGQNTDKHNFIKNNNLKIVLEKCEIKNLKDANLQKIKPNFIKVDQHIVKNVASNKQQQEMLKDIVAIARLNDLFVIAVGIENYDDLEFCIKSGVNFVQGYYIGRPKEDLQQISTKIRDEILYLSNTYEY